MSRRWRKILASRWGTPLSGIGPAAQLSKFGIPVTLDKPGVGANLHDHLQLRMIYKVSGVETLNETYASVVGPVCKWD